MEHFEISPFQIFPVPLHQIDFRYQVQIEFYKYQGTGNDFIIIDSIVQNVPTLTTEQIAFLCHRRFGIGADGLMIISPSAKSDFLMIYYNSDGNESSMCGNGGRCISHLSHHLGYSKNKVEFTAIDGHHDAYVNNESVKLHMKDVHEIIENKDGHFILQTGSPHYVIPTDLDDLDNIVEVGKKIRYSDIYKDDGINVNLTCYKLDKLHVATYERGVEDETYSCGTGVTAAALVEAHKHDVESPITIITKGGELKVHFTKHHELYTDVWLEGPTALVYQGKINI